MADTRAVSSDPNLNRIEAKLNEMERARKSSHTTGTLITILIVAVALIMIWVLLKPGIDAYQNRETYQQALTKEFNQRLQPQVESEGRELIQEVIPVYRTEARAVLQARAPELLRSVEGEIETLSSNLHQQVSTKIDSFRDSIVEEHVEKLTSAFPELSGKTPDELQAYQGRIQQAADRAQDQVAQEIFGPYLEALDGMKANMDKISSERDLSSMSQQELEDHTKDLFLTVLSSRVNFFEEPASGTQPQVTVGSEGANASGGVIQEGGRRRAANRDNNAENAEAKEGEGENANANAEANAEATPSQ